MATDKKEGQTLQDLGVVVPNQATTCDPGNEWLTLRRKQLSLDLLRVSPAECPNDKGKKVVYI